jgi:hypothetical protein
MKDVTESLVAFHSTAEPRPGDAPAAREELTVPNLRAVGRAVRELGKTAGGR